MKTNPEPKNNVGLIQKIKHLTSVIVSRAAMSAKLGQSFDGDRELYEACGYPMTLTYSRYKGRFTRQDIAKRIVTAFPDATWRGIPEVYEVEDEKQTQFEKDWEVLLSGIDIYHFLNRVDKLAGIGSYAVLLLGLDDGADFSQPASPSSKLLYLQPYAENHASISLFETDKKQERYGLPTMYKIQMGVERTDGGGTVTGSGEQRVHWSRIVHVAEGCMESNVYGTPRLECVYNRLQDVETISGGSAEMFWRGAFPGYSLEADADAKLQSTTELEDEIEAYMHGLTRVMRLQGIKANALETQVANPKFHIDVQLQLIAGATGIPVRILTGSERGELASSQDQNNWEHRVDERRKDFAEPFILNPLIDRLIDVGVLTEPKDGYQVDWPDIGALDDKEQAEVAKNRAEALAKYIQSGADAVMPPMAFLTSVMGYTEDEATAMLEDVVDIIRREEAEPVPVVKDEEPIAKEDKTEDEDV